jgi:hypothetical protein
VQTMEENRILKRVLYINLEIEAWDLDQEIDDYMKWGGIE